MFLVMTLFVSIVQISSVQFKDGIYALGKAHNYVLQHVSQKFALQCHL